MIQPQDHNVCRRYGCDIPVSNGQYLCQEHIVKLDDMLRDVPDQIAALNPHDGPTTSTGGSGGGGGSSSGSRPPFNIHQWSVWIELQQLHHARAHTIAYNDPDAGTTYATIKRVTDMADQLLDPEEETAVDINDARRRIHVECWLPMTGKEICAQFAEWGITITRPQLRQWVARGHLMSVGTASDGRSSMFTVLGILTALERVSHELAQETTLV